MEFPVDGLNRWACEPRGEYPENWPEIAEEAKAHAGYTCEHCGMDFEPGTNKAVEAVNADGKPTILTVHHLDGDKSNCTWENLLVCCQRCHLHIQATWAPGQPLPPTWGGPPSWLTARRLVYEESAQTSFLWMVD